MNCGPRNHFLFPPFGSWALTYSSQLLSINRLYLFYARLTIPGKEEKNQDWLPVTGMRFQNGEPIIGLLLLSTSLLRSSSFSILGCSSKEMKILGVNQASAIELSFFFHRPLTGYLLVLLFLDL